MRDLKFAIRQLLKNPGFTAAAVLTLAANPLAFPSISPGNTELLLGVQAPHRQPGWHNANQRPHSLGPRVEPWMAKQPPSEVRRLILANSQNHQTVPGVTERPLVQAEITGEERRAGKCEQQRENFLIRHPLASGIQTDLPNRNGPATQQLALALQYIFVQQIHFLSGLHRQLMRMLAESLPGRAHCLTDCLLAYAAAPLLHNAFPGHPAGDLLQNIRNQDSCAPKSWLSMANVRVGDDVTAHDSLSHIPAINTFSPAASQRSDRKHRQSKIANP
jgi:hypothetical protein